MRILKQSTDTAAAQPGKFDPSTWAGQARQTAKNQATSTTLLWGVGVAAVVVLTPGQRVTTPRPRRYSRIDQMPVAELARAIRGRRTIQERPA